MTWLWALLAIVAGVSNPLQSGSNSALFKGVGAPLVAAFIVYAVGAACLLLTAPMFGLFPRGSLAKLLHLPWWVFIGGACNAVFLISTLLATRRLGSATFTTIVVVSATLTAIALDHFGWLGFDVRAATLGRLAGAAFAIVGVVMIALF